MSKQITITCPACSATLSNQWDTLPVAFGVSWQQSVLDVDLSVPQEIFRFVGVCYWFLQGSVGH